MWASLMTLRISSRLSFLPLLAWLLTVQPVFAKSPQEFDLHVSEAQRYYHEKNYDHSIAELELAYALNALPSLLINIGRCHYLANRPKEALIYYNKALNSKLSRTEREEVTASVAKASIELHEQQEREARESAARQSVVQARFEQFAAAQPPPSTPLYKKPWFWGVFIGVSATTVALGLGFGLGLRTSESAAVPPIRPIDYIPSLTP